MFLPHEIGTEEHERVWWAGDIPQRPALAGGSTSFRGRVLRFLGRREKVCIEWEGEFLGGVEGDIVGFLVGTGRHVGSEGHRTW